MEKFPLYQLGVVPNPKFPVVRFAELAEEALSKAKLKDASVKNAFSIFNTVIQWSDWKDILKFRII